MFARRRYRSTRSAIAEFIRRFLLPVLPRSFHRIRHYGLFANGHRAEKLALCRTLLHVRPAPIQKHAERDRRIHPPLPPPRAPQILSSDPTLRPLRQRTPCREASALPNLAPCSPGADTEARGARSPNSSAASSSPCSPDPFIGSDTTASSPTDTVPRS